MEYLMRKQIILGLVISMLSMSSFAQMSNKDMLDKLQKEHPKLNVDSVEYIPSVKLYEIKRKGTPMLSYTNQNIDFLLAAGEIIDPVKKSSITSEREHQNVMKFFNNLPYNTAITYKFGKGTRKIAIFTDPDCPFCKETDKEIHSKLTNSDLTVSYFMNPLRIPGHEQAPLKAKKIYCSPNKEKAWTDWMLNGILPNNPGTCKTPVDQHKEIADSVRFNATPTIIYDNGLITRQKVTAEEIMQLLNSKK